MQHLNTIHVLFITREPITYNHHFGLVCTSKHTFLFSSVNATLHLSLEVRLASQYWLQLGLGIIGKHCLGFDFAQNTQKDKMLSASHLCLLESEVTTVNRCLDAAKACNIDETCQKLRTEYVSACIQPSARSGPCNRPKCNKALRKFFDRVPPDYTHELLFCPCTDTACAERRRQTIVPSCSYEDKDKPNCLAQLRICKADYVCR